MLPRKSSTHREPPSLPGSGAPQRLGRRCVIKPKRGCEFVAAAIFIDERSLACEGFGVGRGGVDQFCQGLRARLSLGSRFGIVGKVGELVGVVGQVAELGRKILVVHVLPLARAAREDELMSSVHDLISSAVAETTASLSRAGDWLSGEQRLAAAREARDARTNKLDKARRQALSPNAVDGGHRATDQLSAEAMEVVHRVSSDPGRLTRAWADEMISSLGEETYTELVGIAACTAAVDMFAWATEGSDAELREPTDGSPTRVRPDDVGDVGAWVSQQLGAPLANVTRSLSLVPTTNAAWIGLVQALYSRGPEFLELEWSRALSRPQVELVAARTTAELECFY